MSRDLTPKEVRMIQEHYNMPNIVDTLVFVSNDGTKTPVYSNEQKEISHRYNKLGTFGFDMLMICHEYGVLSSEKGKTILQEIEDYFNGKEISNKELLDKTISWYEGNLMPGYYMSENNEAFASYIKSLL